MNLWSLSPDLDGHVVLVSGGTRGIGLAIAQSFVHAGARAVITGRSRENLDSALMQFGSGSDRVLGHVADAASEDDADRVIGETLASLGRIDTLVNNAATTARFGRLVSVPLEDWDAVMRTNLRAPMVWSRFVQPIMSDLGGGSIINIGSSEGTRLTGGLGTYAVSKAALQMLTRVCAREWASDGIRVNYLAPGVIDTEFSADLVDHIRSTGRHINPLEIIGSPDDVGFIAVMLASEGCRFVTGATIAVDGGETA